MWECARIVQYAISRPARPPRPGMGPVVGAAGLAGSLILGDMTDGELCDGGAESAEE